MNSNRVTGSPRVTERVADVVGRGARDGRLADALGIEDRPSIASPLGRDTSDLETLRSSNEFTPQWGSTARERSASAKRPSPLAIETDRSKARRASPSPMDSTPQDEEMPDPADVHIHSTPESRASHVDPRSGDSRRRGSTPSRPSGVGDCPVDDPRRYARASGAPERIEISTPRLIPPVNQVTLGQRRCLICTSRRCSREVRFLAQSRRRSTSLLTKSGY